MTPPVTADALRQACLIAYWKGEATRLARLCAESIVHGRPITMAELDGDGRPVTLETLALWAATGKTES